MREGQQSITLAMWAVEPYTGGSDMGIVATFREELDFERLFSAYASLVSRHACLRSSLVFDSKKRRYEWQSMPEAQWRAWLESERAHYTSTGDPEHLASAWHPINATFPFFVRRIDERRIFLSLQHAWVDGKRGLTWLEALLQAYHTGQAPPLADELSNGDGDAPEVGVPPTWKSVREFVRTLTKRMPAARKNAAHIADLSTGVPRTRDGFWVLNRDVVGEDLARLHAHALRARVGMTQVLCATIAEAVSEFAPKASKVRLCVPVDLLTAGAGLRAGNFVGTLPIELDVGPPWLEQVQREFGAIDRGFAHGYNWVLERMAGAMDHRKMIAQMAADMSLEHAHKQRGYLRQFSAIITNLDRVTSPFINQHVKSLAVHGKFEFLIFGFVQLRDTLGISVTAPKSRYERALATQLLDRVVQKLHALGAGSSQGVSGSSNGQSWAGPQVQQISAAQVQ
jgi:hypothetical protein